MVSDGENLGRSTIGSDVKAADWQQALDSVERAGQEIQAQVKRLEHDLETHLAQGISSDRIVEITLNGNYRLIDLKIYAELPSNSAKFLGSFTEAHHSAYEQIRLYIQQRLAVIHQPFQPGV